MFGRKAIIIIIKFKVIIVMIITKVTSIIDRASIVTMFITTTFIDY
jgi:hypothetical protein